MGEDRPGPSISAHPAATRTSCRPWSWPVIRGFTHRLLTNGSAGPRSKTAAAPVATSPLLFALDEAANIAPLPDLPNNCVEGGGQGMLTLVCLQDMSQARARWGPDADGWLSFFGSKVMLRGIEDVRTLEMLSALAGEEEVPTRAVSRPRLPVATTRCASVLGRLCRPSEPGPRADRRLPPPRSGAGSAGRRDLQGARGDGSPHRRAQRDGLTRAHPLVRRSPGGRWSTRGAASTSGGLAPRAAAAALRRLAAAPTPGFDLDS